MNDFNQSNQLHFEFAEYATANMPSFETMVSQKSQVIKDGAFDPHQLMVKKKLTDSGENVDTTPKHSWPDQDIKALEDFCKKYGILGVNVGKMSPIAAIAMLKSKLGIIEPSESVVSYSDTMNKRTLLKG